MSRCALYARTISCDFEHALGHRNDLLPQFPADLTRFQFPTPSEPLS